MRPSIQPSDYSRYAPPTHNLRALKRVAFPVIALAACCFVSTVNADATLTYELSGGDAEKAVKKFSTARFFIRIDEAADEDTYLLFQAGKFFPLFEVDNKNKTYTRLTAPVIPYMSPQARKHHGADKAEGEEGQKQASETRGKPAPPLKPTKKSRKVAGIECRVVHQLENDKPVIEHCMANGARLGITEREVISMARTFEMARNRDLDWLGIGSRDEAFISVQSKDLRNDRVLTLTAVSTKPLEQGYLRIPREYKEIKPEEGEKAAAAETQTETATEQSSEDALGQGAPRAPESLR